MASMIFDLLLLVGFTLRTIRLVCTDTITDRYLRRHVVAWAERDDTGSREFWADGLECGFCVGFWLTGLCLLSLYLAGGPGDAALWWHVLAGWFTLNYVTAHIWSRIG
jgi:hypothetical protein